jgi:preprotein translocase subunit YajC
MSKWLEIFTLDYCDDILATIIFVEFMVHFWYMFIKSPRHQNKLRNALKEFI